MCSTWLLLLLARRYLFHLTLKCRYMLDSDIASYCVCTHTASRSDVYSYCFRRLLYRYCCCCYYHICRSFHSLHHILLFFFCSYRSPTQTRTLTHRIICDVRNTDPRTKNNNLQFLGKLSESRSLIFVISAELLVLIGINFVISSENLWIPTYCTLFLSISHVKVVAFFF